MATIPRDARKYALLGMRPKTLMVRRRIAPSRTMRPRRTYDVMPSLRGACSNVRREDDPLLLGCYLRQFKPFAGKANRLDIAVHILRGLR
jgi:hypothetical protein